MGFSRQEYWSGLPCPSPVDLPKPGIEPGSPALQADALPRELLGHPGGPRHRGEHLSRVLCLLVQSPSHARLLVTPWTAARQVSLSLTQPCLTPGDPVDCSTPGLPVPHHLLDFAHAHVHCIRDAVQPSHSPSPSPSAVNLSQHQGLFQ